MSFSFSFGKFEGKSYEWCFFKAPWYAKWIYAKDIHRQRHCFVEEERDYFLELYTRASHLAVTCEQCNEPATSMGLTTLSSGLLGSVGFFCERCEYLGGSRTGYEAPSFFVHHPLPRIAQTMITKEIQRRFIDGRLTQANMEAYFGNEIHFTRYTPGFFEVVGAV